LSQFALDRTPPEMTTFAGVRRLPAGAALRFEAGGRPEIEHYFSLAELRDQPTRDPEEVKQDFVRRSHEYLEAILDHVDGQAAILFSSGIDSAINLELIKTVAGQTPGWLSVLSLDYPRLWRWRYSEFPEAQKNAAALGAPIERVYVDGRKFHRAARELAGRPSDFPLCDRSTVLERIAVKRLVNEGKRYVFTGFNADIPFCGHPWMMEKARSRSEVFTGVKAPMSAEQLAQSFGHPVPARIAYLEPLLSSCGLSASDLRDWISHYRAGLPEQLSPYAGLDYLRAQQLVTQESVASLWTKEFLALEEEFGVTFISPFMDLEVAKLGYQLPLTAYFRGSETKVVLRDLLTERTGLRLEKRAMPTPNRPWSVMPDYLRYAARPEHRRLCRGKWLRNIRRGGRDYGLLHDFCMYAAWLEAVA
jgi:asparagine synthetase B (glutamine-hydrolysing)